MSDVFPSRTYSVPKLGEVTLAKAGYDNYDTGRAVVTLKNLLEDQRIAWEKGWGRMIQNAQLDIEELRAALIRRNKKTVIRAMKRNNVPLEAVYGTHPQPTPDGVV